MQNIRCSRKPEASETENELLAVRESHENVSDWNMFVDYSTNRLTVSTAMLAIRVHTRA